MGKNFDVIIIGAGLAGLSCSLELTLKGKKILLLESRGVVGGRTSSYFDNGVNIESGFHRYIGFYTHLPNLLKKAGVRLQDLVMWEEKLHIRVDDGKPIVLGVAPLLGIEKTLKGLLGNQLYLSLKDKLSLIPFFLKGYKDYWLNPQKLDTYSIKEYADMYGVTQNAFNYIVTSLSAGVFFLPPDRYSAYVFFGLFAPGIKKFYKLRIGAFLGGMTEVMCQPIAECIEKNGGIIKTNSKVASLNFHESKIIGVTLQNGHTYFSDNTVIATTLNAAKQLLQPLFSNEAWYQPLNQLQSMPAVSFQIELTEPALPMDVTTFAPLTHLASFTEQSRTTFQQSNGRLSIILSPPEYFLAKDPNETLQIVIEEAKKIGLHLEDKILDFRQVNHHADFHTLEPGNQHLRPTQSTPVEGLILAGDYTKQPYFSTMEGAVFSGVVAANLIK